MTHCFGCGKNLGGYLGGICSKCADSPTVWDNYVAAHKEAIRSKVLKSRRRRA